VPTIKSPTWEYLTSLEAKLMHRRNSLILLAETIAEHHTGA